MSSAVGHVHAGSGLVAAWVGQTPISVTEVDVHLERLRAGPRAALLPVADSPEGRQLRRWVTQVVVTRQLLEAAARELDVCAAPAPETVVPDRQAVLELGGIVADVLSRSAPARAVFAEVTRSVRAAAHDVESYYVRNRDEFRDRDGRPREFQGVADIIDDRLTASLRRRCFVDWLDQRRARLVRLEPGHEHPGDPHQPDATHRH